MTVYSNNSYIDQDDGHILKDGWKQQYIMFPVPIAFLNDKFMAVLGMETKKEEEEDDAKLCSLKVPMNAEDKDSKMYLVKIRKYEGGSPEYFMKWRMTLNEQIKNHE
jgi:hypothetical protein